MIQSVKNYTLIFIVIFITLLSLQGYFLYNSYLLEEKQLKSSATEIANGVQEKLSNSEKRSSDEELIKSLNSFANDTILQHQHVNYIQSNIEKSRIKLSQQADSLLGLATKKNKFIIGLHKEIYSIYDEVHGKELIQKPLTIYNTVEEVNRPTVINQNIWSSNNVNTEKDDMENLTLDEVKKYKIRSNVTFELVNVKYLVLQKLIPLFLINLCIILLLIYVYWATGKNLKKLEQKNTQLHLTIDSIAHELNTPITTLKFATQQLENSANKSLIIRQVERMQRIVQNIFTENSNSELKLTDSELNQYLEEIELFYPNLIITTSVVFNHNNCLKSKDFFLISTNLIENAAKYSATQIDITFEFSDKIKLHFKDNGIGIPSEEIPFVMEKYYRINRSINQQVNGVGLGLYLVKKCVDTYYGTIDITNNSSKGVSFSITLPNEN